MNNETITIRHLGTDGILYEYKPSGGVSKNSFSPC